MLIILDMKAKTQNIFRSLKDDRETVADLPDTIKGVSENVFQL